MGAMEQRIYSLDEKIQNGRKPNDSSDTTLSEIIESKSPDAQDESISRLFLRQDLIESLYRRLDRESAHMLMLRFGLVDPTVLPDGYDGPLTIAKVSQLVGMKPDKVRRKIIKSLENLKCTLGNEWKDYEQILN